MSSPRIRRWSVLGRALIFAAAATALSGCIIIPEHHYRHSYND